jgi:hypothetical protein
MNSSLIQKKTDMFPYELTEAENSQLWQWVNGQEDLLLRIVGILNHQEQHYHPPFFIKSLHGFCVNKNIFQI